MPCPPFALGRCSPPNHLPLWKKHHATCAFSTVPQAHAEVPLCLVLGLTTSESALLSLLPSDIIDRCMALHSFKLVGAGACG